MTAEGVVVYLVVLAIQLWYYGKFDGKTFTIAVCVYHPQQGCVTVK
jgi:hypothetical protein